MSSARYVLAEITAHDIEHDYHGPFQEYADVQLTSYLSFLTKSASILNDVRDFCPSELEIG